MTIAKQFFQLFNLQVQYVEFLFLEIHQPNFTGTVTVISKIVRTRSTGCVSLTISLVVCANLCLLVSR